MPEWMNGIELPAIFIMLFIGALGIPFGSATIYTLLAVSAGASGRIGLLPLIAVAAAAATLGGQTAHAIGTRLGPRLIGRYGARIGLTFERIRVLYYLFAVYGGPAIFFARFMGWLRAPAAYLAGASHISGWKYLAYNLPASIIWAGYSGGLGYGLGGWMTHLSPATRLAVIVIVILVMAGILVRGVRARHRITARAAAMFPDPSTLPRAELHRPPAKDSE